MPPSAALPYSVLRSLPPSLRWLTEQTGGVDALVTMHAAATMDRLLAEAQQAFNPDLQRVSHADSIAAERSGRHQRRSRMGVIERVATSPALVPSVVVTSAAATQVLLDKPVAAAAIVGMAAVSSATTCGAIASTRAFQQRRAEQAEARLPDARIAETSASAMRSNAWRDARDAYCQSVDNLYTQFNRTTPEVERRFQSDMQWVEDHRPVMERLVDAYTRDINDLARSDDMAHSL
jgi:hypothetical protein